MRGKERKGEREEKRERVLEREREREKEKLRAVEHGPPCIVYKTFFYFIRI